MENFWATAQEPVTGIDWIKPGINNVVFDGFSVKEDKNGNPMLVRSFYPIGGSSDKGGRSQYESFNLGVRQRTLGNKTVDESNYYSFSVSLLHFLDAMVQRTVSAEILQKTMPACTAQNDDIKPNAAQLQAFVDAINPVVKGKTLRYKFVGEEKESTKNPGETVDVPALRVAYIPYAEALEEGAEKAVLAQTKLRFDRTKKSDMKPLVPQAATGDFTPDSDNPGF